MKDFNNNIINCSENTSLGPTLHRCDKDTLPQAVSAVMNKLESTGAKVYHIIHDFKGSGNPYGFFEHPGECWSLLFLSPDDSKETIDFAKGGHCCGYVYNASR